MPVSQQLKCIFVHIPKTGGTSIETALGMFGNWKVENCETLFGLIQSAEIEEKKFLSHFLQHLTFPEIQSLVPGWGGFFSFSFVRNPWDRMVSVYSNPDPNMIMHAKSDGIELQGISFHDFLLNTEKIQQIHLLEQHKFILDQQKRALVHFIGKFENLERDFKNVCQSLGIERQLPHCRKSQHRHYRDYYTAETREIVTQRYQQDIDIFQYRF
jgi:hypothetical protein